MTPACVACRGTDLRSFFTGTDRLGAVDPARGFPYLRCASCGTAVAWPRPDAETLAAAYRSQAYSPHREQHSVLERLLEPLARREARRVALAAPPRGRILDVGCGSGTFMARLRAVGWAGGLAGLEPSPEAAAWARERLSVPVRVGGVEALGGEAPAGAVVLRHVIEHVEDPEGTLRAIREVLEPSGVLYLGTPDARALSASAFGRWWSGYDPPRHLFTFTASGLRTLLRRAGFVVVSEHADFAPDYWTGSLHSALDRGRNQRWTAIAASNANPLAAVPAVAGAAVEVALRRSPMYAVLARSTRG